MAIEVKVGKVPGRIVTVALEEGNTVAEALRQADIVLTDGETLSVNGSPSGLEGVLRSNATVLVTRKIKGN